MWRSKEGKCIADIRYNKTEIGAVETCITCPNCPRANFVERLNSGTTRGAKEFAKKRASIVIEKHCIVFEKLKSEGKIEEASRSFHRKLP